jgi:DNA-binding Xre family transcriptional regulator
MGRKKQYLGIRHLLEDFEMDQHELAEATGMGYSTLNMRLNGVSPWRQDEIIKVCRVLHIRQGDVGRLFFMGLE